MRLIQIVGADEGRRLAIASDDELSVVDGFRTAYDAAHAALSAGVPFSEFLGALPVTLRLSYDEVYNARTPWKILPPFDHPDEPARCMVSGTGLTHLASAETRQKMHAGLQHETDSMRMYRWGEEGGRPAPGEIGTAPEWFYKGNGLVLRAHGEPLTVHSFSGDGGEEPEIAGVYLIDAQGQARRIGMATGNEFSDHIMERRNYLYLAPSKLRQCSIGPELIVDAGFEFVPGFVKIRRGDETIWSKELSSGERRMAHSLGNMEHHHFKYPQHRRPGDVHIHFYGAGAFSFGAGIELQDRDIAEISFEGFGRPLRNPILKEAGPDRLVMVRPA
jgi:hypothetical protein